LRLLVNNGTIKLFNFPEKQTMRNDERAEVIKRVQESVLQDPAKREHFLKVQSLTKPIIEELAEIGYNLERLGDLRHKGKPWKSALPVLLRWLPKVDDPGIKDEIVRCLSVPWLGNKGTALLIDEFRKYAPILPNAPNPWVGNQLIELTDEEKKSGPFFHLAWAIGNALSIVDVRGFESQIIELCRNATYGITRQMLVLGFGRFQRVEAEETALEVLRDESVKLHAVMALGKMKSRRALPELEKLLADKKPAIRKEARKAITSITQ
jgi:hypothetical protein